MKAALYIRVSTEDQQRDGHSLEAQRAVLERYCGSRFPHPLDVGEVFVDAGVSGSIPLGNRPEGRRLLEYLASGSATHVVAVKLDRLWRGALNCLETVNTWDKQGITLHLLDLTLDTSTPQGRMFLTIVASFAQFERDMVRERTKATAAHLKASGRVYGSTPYGFDRRGDRLIPNEFEQARLADMRTMRSGAKPLSYAEIAKRLNEAGTPAKGGGRWHPYSVQKVLKGAAT